MTATRQRSAPRRDKKTRRRKLTRLAAGPKAFFDQDNIRIFNSNFIASCPIPDNSVDLIVTSPPYNVDISYGKHKDDQPYEQYKKFTRNWLKQCFRLAKPEGRLCVNIALDKNKGGHQSIYADLTTIAQEEKWNYHCTIVWQEGNISRNTAWGSWKSASAPYIIAPVEMIAVFYKDAWRKTLGSRLNDVVRDEFLEWVKGVWSFNGQKKKGAGGHPAAFPIELPRRCIKLFSFVGDVVLDPFLGSGTTLIACLETRRKGIGIDIDKSYCRIARNRIIESMNHPLQQISQASLNVKELEKTFGSHKSLKPPGTNQIALVLAKACKLPCGGLTTKSGHRVHPPSRKQVQLWIGKVMESKVVQTSKTDLPTNAQIAIALSKILKIPVGGINSLEALPSADQIKLWVKRQSVPETAKAA